jgi:predicted transcriptional regulator
MTGPQTTTYPTLMRDTRAYIYGEMADKLERDPIGPDGGGRAVVVNGRGFRWSRFHDARSLVWITTMDGRMVALTPKQAEVFDLAKSLIYDPKTMREMAAMLHVAPSTVSRALTKLAAWGLIAYVSMRGRYASTVIVLRELNDGRDRFRQAAKARVRAWSEAAQRRISRLAANVAPYIIEGRGRVDDYYYWARTTTVRKDATLTAQRFTPEELREAGII